MCYFVFVGTPRVRHEGFTRRLVDAGCQVAATGNVDVRAAFPNGDVVSVVVHNGCSCDLYAERSVRFDEEAQRARYRKKNWSDAKIERAILGKRPRERPAFAAFRHALAVAIREVGSARILAHSFSGSVDAEPMQIAGTSRMSVEEYLCAEGVYAPDVVHDIRAG